MNHDVKYLYKTSYRINGRIRGIINNACRDICKETGIKLSLGKISRTVWLSLGSNPALRKKIINDICKTVLKEAFARDNKNYAQKNSSKSR